MRLDFPGVVGDIDIYMRVLRAICGETADKSMIDLCCAFAPNTPKLGFSNSMYIDIIDRKLDHPDTQSHFHRMDVLCIDPAYHIKRDVAICSDGIEHFYPGLGRELIDVMESISYKQIIFTPLGEIFKLHNTGPDDPEAHHSLWTPQDFRGWATIVFPDYHKVWNGGAFFAWKCNDIEKDFERVKNLIQI